MKYHKIKRGFFISRPNRFLANVMLDGEIEVCHVKNTGRCKELLIEGAIVFLEKSKNPNRKTKYDLIAVYKGDKLVNIDSQAPNKVVQEYLPEIFKDIVCIRPETKYKNSRFDFYVETKQNKIFIEVKGVTLEDNGVVRFPDAPTERGLKHIQELIACKKEGYQAYIIFVVQMEDVTYFEPNLQAQPEFARELYVAKKSGVEILCFCCRVTPDSLEIYQKVPCKIELLNL
ncbi:MAG: DNA/RNA nuclease SfsA [Lachnospiraceae bacterium]|nr:DNA/RNA nuclease SfsA [Lachnospiraceae bacterium]